MHDHRIACSSAIKALQKPVKDIVVALHKHVGFGGEQVLEETRALKETDKFITTTKSTYGISGSYNTLG